MCDWYFSEEDYNADLEDEIVARVRQDPELDYFTKKALILCWFVTVECLELGDEDCFERGSQATKDWLAKNNLQSIEAFLDSG